MDDILIAAASQEELKQVHLCLKDNVSSAELSIVPEIWLGVHLGAVHVCGSAMCTKHMDPAVLSPTLIPPLSS